jgi:hypothetical protein
MSPTEEANGRGKMPRIHLLSPLMHLSHGKRRAELNDLEATAHEAAPSATRGYDDVHSCMRQEKEASIAAAVEKRRPRREGGSHGRRREVPSASGGGGVAAVAMAVGRRRRVSR